MALVMSRNGRVKKHWRCCNWKMQNCQKHSIDKIVNWVCFSNMYKVHVVLRGSVILHMSGKRRTEAYWIFKYCLLILLGTAGHYYMSYCYGTDTTRKHFYFCPQCGFCGTNTRGWEGRTEARAKAASSFLYSSLVCMMRLLYSIFK